MTQPVLRFAPSPNGRLHLGHGYSALLNAALASAWGGRFLLRIEDIDIGRCRPQYEQAIYDDLAWLGLDWERPVRRQSEHFGFYREALKRLDEAGLVYPCFCSRQEIAAAVRVREAETGETSPRDPDGTAHYSGTCRSLPRETADARMDSGAPHAWRLDNRAALAMARSAAAPADLVYVRFDLDGAEERVVADPGRWGDAVIARKDVPTSYHLSVVLDDAEQGVTHVVRGRDLEPATDLHVLLQRALGLPTPRYHHHALIVDERGAKLSKSLVCESLADLCRRGVSAAEIRRRLGFPGHSAPST